MMTAQLCNLVLTLVVGITVPADAASGHVVNTDGIIHDLPHNDAELRVNKIVNGLEAHPSAHPYMALVKTHTYENGHWYTDKCGGVLIHREWVLTAGHCVDETDSERKPDRYFSVTLGAHRLHPPSTNEVIMAVEKIFNKWKPTDTTHDIALVKLKRPANITGPGVKPAKLKMLNHGHRGLCEMTGWGDTVYSPHASSGSNILMEGSVALESDKECARLYRHYFDPRIHLCAIGYSDIYRPCDGDSGSPLMCTDEKTGDEFLAGIFFRGAQICDVKTPALFTKVSSYRTWIKHTIGLDVFQ